jgi:hypothetical protein
MKDNGIGGELKGALVVPKGIQFVQLDNKYTFYPLEKVMAAIKDIPREKYVPESHDCDNFAQDAEAHVVHELPGCPFGFAKGKSATGGPHAVNVFWASKDGRVQRYYYDATGYRMLTEFDVSFIMV